MAPKRPGGAQGAKSSRKRGRGRYYALGSAKGGHGGHGIPFGREGVLVTCPGGRERNCTREVLSLLLQFWEDATGENATAEAPRTGMEEGENDVEDDDVEDEDDEEEEGEHGDEGEEREEGGDGEGGKQGEGKIEGGERGIEESKEEGSGSREKDNIGGDIDKLIESEMDDIRTMKKARFSPVNSGCKGLVFIEHRRERESDLSTTSLAEAIVRKTMETKLTQTRYTMKLLPVESTCYASVSEIKQAMAPLVERHFSVKEGEKPLTFAVVLEVRAHSGLDKMAVITAVAEMVPKPHKVDLSHPERSILVQVVKTTCTLAVVREFKTLAKYNLRQIVCPEDNLPKAEKFAHGKSERKFSTYGKRERKAASASASKESDIENAQKDVKCGSDEHVVSDVGNSKGGRDGKGENAAEREREAEVREREREREGEGAGGEQGAGDGVERGRVEGREVGEE